MALFSLLSSSPCWGIISEKQVWEEGTRGVWRPHRHSHREAQGPGDEQVMCPQGALGSMRLREGGWLPEGSAAT